MIGLGVVVWIVWGVNEQGYFDGFLNQYFGHNFTSIEDTTCRDLKDSAVGQTLSNETSTWKVMGVRNFVEMSRNDNELVCLGEMVSEGLFTTLMITLSDREGDLFVEYQAF